MAKKKRGRKMPKWKKWAKAIISTAGTGIGATIALSPTFRGLTNLFTGTRTPQEAVVDITFDVAGINAPAGVFVPDVGKLVGTAVTAAVGIGIMQLFKYFAKRI